MQATLTPETLSVAAGALLSLLFSYVPGLSTWYAGLEPVRKRLLMAGLLLLVALCIAGLSCARLLTLVVCEQAGIGELLQMFVLALIANQSAYLISPPTAAVREAKG